MKNKLSEGIALFSELLGGIAPATGPAAPYLMGLGALGNIASPFFGSNAIAPESNGNYPKLKYGGKINVEGGEIALNSNRGVNSYKGPSHKKGGIDVNVSQNFFVLSDKAGYLKGKLHKNPKAKDTFAKVYAKMSNRGIVGSQTQNVIRTDNAMFVNMQLIKEISRLAKEGTDLYNKIRYEEGGTVVINPIKKNRFSEFINRPVELAPTLVPHVGYNLNTNLYTGGKYTPTTYYLPGEQPLPPGVAEFSAPGNQVTHVSPLSKTGTTQLSGNINSLVQKAATNLLGGAKYNPTNISGNSKVSKNSSNPDEASIAQNRQLFFTALASRIPGLAYNLISSSKAVKEQTPINLNEGRVLSDISKTGFDNQQSYNQLIKSQDKTLRNLTNILGFDPAALASNLQQVGASVTEQTANVDLQKQQMDYSKQMQNSQMLMQIGEGNRQYTAQNSVNNLQNKAMQANVLSQLLNYSIPSGADSYTRQLQAENEVRSISEQIRGDVRNKIMYVNQMAPRVGVGLLIQEYAKRFGMSYQEAEKEVTVLKLK